MGANLLKPLKNFEGLLAMPRQGLRRIFKQRGHQVARGHRGLAQRHGGTGKNARVDQLWGLLHPRQDVAEQVYPRRASAATAAWR